MARVVYIHMHNRAKLMLGADKSVTFKNHIFQTTDETLQRRMEKHRKFGIAFRRVESESDYARLRQFTAEATVYMRGPQQTVKEMKPDSVTIDRATQRKSKAKTKAKV